MTAPAKIWATPDDGYCTASELSGDKRDALGFVAYVRADIADSLRARLAQADADRAELVACVLRWPTIADGIDFDAIKARAEAAKEAEE